MKGGVDEPRSPERAGRGLCRDALVGLAFGAILAVVSILALLMLPMILPTPKRAMLNFSRRQVEYGHVGETHYTVPFREYSWRNLRIGCAIFLAFGMSITAGLYVGRLAGGPTRIAAGGLVGYLVPFFAYGVYVQRTVGWATWLGDETASRDSRPQPLKRAGSAEPLSCPSDSRD